MFETKDTIISLDAYRAHHEDEVNHEILPESWKRQSKNKFEGVLRSYNGHVYNAVIKDNLFTFDVWIQNPPRNFWAQQPTILNTGSGWAGLSFERDPKKDTLASFIALIEEILDIAWGKRPQDEAETESSPSILPAE